MGQITWGNKVGVVPKQTRENQVWDDDMNEIKDAVNDNYRYIDGFFVPTATNGRQTWAANDFFIGEIGSNRLVAGFIVDQTADLPNDIDTAKVTLVLDSADNASATTDAGDLTTGVLDDARVQESNVTQHQSALSITEAQISDLRSYLLLSGGQMTGDLDMQNNSILNLVIDGYILEAGANHFAIYDVATGNGTNAYYRFERGSQQSPTSDWSVMRRFEVDAAITAAGSGSTTFDGLTDTDINSPTSGQYLEWNGSAWVNVNAPSGSLTTAQANSIANSRKVEPNWETSGRALTLDDFIQQDSGKEQTRSGLGVDDGGSYTFTLSDAVITSALALNLPLPIYAVGSTIIIELENGSTYQFKDYSGTTGDIWTITNSSGAAILKTGNVITSGGVISNSAPPATYTDGNALNGIINENDLDGITGTWNPTDFDVTVIVDPEDAGKFAVRVERLAATGTAYDFDIPLTGLVSATTYTTTLRAQRTAAANYFQLRLRTVSGWTSDDTQTPTSSFSDMTFAAQAATSTPPVLNIRAIGGGTTGDILIIKDLIVTAQ